jgi:hypothetical protein
MGGWQRGCKCSREQWLEACGEVVSPAWTPLASDAPEKARRFPEARFGMAIVRPRA